MQQDAPDAAEEAIGALDALVAPLEVAVDRRREEDEEARGVGAVLRDDLLRRDDVALRLRHLRAVLEDHALREQVRERLVEIDEPRVVQHLREEARVEEVQDGVLYAADVLVDGRPVVHLVLREGLQVVLRVGVAQVVPRRADERVHRVRLARRVGTAFRALAVHEVLARGERREAALIERDVVRQQHGQVFLRHEHLAAMRAVDDRDRCAPVALARDEPVAQAEIHAALAEAFLLRLVHDALHRRLDVEAAELRRVDEDAVLVRIRLRHLLELQLAVARLQRDDLRDAVLRCEHPVARILRRHADDRARAVVREHVVRDPDLHFLAVEGVHTDDTRVDTLFLRLARRALHLARVAHALHEGADLLRLAALLADGVDERMLRREREERDAVDRIGARRVGGDLLPERRAVERELETLAAADPVLLHRLDALRPALELIEVLQQHIGVVRDFQEPLREVLLLHGRVAAPALAVDDLLVREHRTAGIAPVDRRLFLVSEAALVEELEEPLRPLVVRRVARLDLAVPVVGEAHLLLLALHVLDVAVRPVRGLHAVLDGRVLRGHAERVEAHRMQHVVALHRLVARHDIADGVVAHVPHVEVARRIREHLERVVFRARGIGLRLVDLLLFPFFLPFLLDFLWIVAIHTFPPHKTKAPGRHTASRDENSRYHPA